MLRVASALISKADRRTSVRLSLVGELTSCEPKSLPITSNKTTTPLWVLLFYWRIDRDWLRRNFGSSLRSPACFRLPEPCCQTLYSRVQTPAFSRIYTKTPHKVGFRCKWRIDRDSNPGYPLEVYTISNRAPSTTRPSIHFISFINLIKYILFCNKFFIFFIMWL